MATSSASTPEAKRVKVWNDRIAASNADYDKWAKLYETKKLEEYYLGRHWRGVQETVAQKLYVINLVFATIETNKPSMIFHRPQIRMGARPGRTGTMGSDAEARAKLCEDTVQTFIDDPDVNFAASTSLALHEAHFRFGIVEVGYSADWMDNPHAGKPVLREDEDTPIKDEDGQEVLQPERIPTNEALYVKRIPACDYRVSMSSCNILEENDWVAYRSWHYVEDIKDNPAYKNTSGLKSTGQISKDMQVTTFGDEEREKHYGMVCVWKIWDLRKKVRHVIVDGHKKFLIEGKPFTNLPHAAIKFYDILDSFYPCPPVYQWLSPQDEINETREAQRAHRRRFYRRYTYMKGTVDETELAKMETGGDGAVIEVNSPDPIVPIQDAPMGADVWQNLDESKNDFLGVSGVGDDQRGIADSETATQANIIDTRNRLRESSSRTKVGDWLAQIARLMLMTIRENMTAEFWIKTNVDIKAVEAESQAMQQALAASMQMGQAPMGAPMGAPPPQDPNMAQDPSMGGGAPMDPMAMQQAQMTPGPAMLDVLRTQMLYEQITSDMLDNIDVDVTVELASMSPVTQATQRESWNQVLALLTNPQLVSLLAGSELLLRKTLSLYDVKSETDVREIQKLCQMAVMALQQQAQQAQMTEAKDKAKKAGVTPEMIESAGQEGAGGSQPQAAPNVPQSSSVN